MWAEAALPPRPVSLLTSCHHHLSSLKYPCRAQVGEYGCRICRQDPHAFHASQQRFTAGPKLWEHATTDHCILRQASDLVDCQPAHPPAVGPPPPRHVGKKSQCVCLTGYGESRCHLVRVDVV